MKHKHGRHVEYVEVYSGREPEHPTVVEVIRRDPDYSPERTDRRPSETYIVSRRGQNSHEMFLSFHEGGPPSAGLNGWLVEDLVAILHHRMSRHQAGPFACEENARVVKALEDAMDALLERRQARQARGVSATQEV